MNKQEFIEVLKKALIAGKTKKIGNVTQFIFYNPEKEQFELTTSNDLIGWSGKYETKTFPTDEDFLSKAEELGFLEDLIEVYNKRIETEKKYETAANGLLSYLDKMDLRDELKNKMEEILKNLATSDFRYYLNPVEESTYIITYYLTLAEDKDENLNLQLVERLQDCYSCSASHSRPKKSFEELVSFVDENCFNNSDEKKKSIQ